MGSWAAYQEGIADLPVFKRARHGIHFKRPDGQIEAAFSGKPCHYEDGGAWRPIDTKPLLLGDGKYGCQHSPVRIAADGTVSIEGAKYAQRARLINGKNIVQNDDHLVRTFSNGEQRLYITEDGFRSEITLFSMPSLGQALYLVANVSGKLPGKYIQHPTTMIDAKGNEYVYDTAANFRTWLEGAVYPVVIDPDFGSGANDGAIVGDKTTYADARSTSSLFRYTVAAYIVGQRKVSDTQYWVMRHFYLFDTSSIGAGSTVNQANLVLNMRDREVQTSFYLYITQCDWSALAADPTNTTHMETAYDNCLSGTKETNTLGEYTGTTGLGTKTSGNLATAYINKTGITYYGVLSSRDYENLGVTDNQYVSFAFSENTTPAYRPYLTVTYTAGGIAIPVVQYYYDRLRRK